MRSRGMCFISLHTWHRYCRDLNIDISDVEVEGVNGDVLRNYGSAVEIKARDLKGVRPSACKADEQFSVKAI